MLGLGEPWRGAARARLRRSSWAGAGALLQVACSVKFLGAEAVLSAASRVAHFSLEPLPRPRLAVRRGKKASLLER